MHSDIDRGAFLDETLCIYPVESTGAAELPQVYLGAANLYCRKNRTAGAIKSKSMSLMTFEEMKRRYGDGEDSLELTIEKWLRIKQFSDKAFLINHFQDILRAAVVPILLCTEYVHQCSLCPIYDVCKQGRSEEWITVMRIIQAYAIAGDLLPKEPFVGHIELFQEKLNTCREHAVEKAH